MTFSDILKFSLKLAFLSLISSCTVNKPSVDLLSSQYGSGKLTIELSHKLQKTEMVFDRYCYVDKLRGARRLVIEEFPVGMHFVRIYSGSWDTTIYFEVLPRQFNSLYIKTH